MKKYCETYKNSIYDTSVTSGPIPRFEGATADVISKQCDQICPLNKLQDRRAWRDLALTKLSILKKEMNQNK